MISSPGKASSQLEFPPAPRWAWWIATGFGSGRLRPAPGTWGSVAALLGWLLFTGLVVMPFAARVLRHPPGGRALAFGYWGFECLFLLMPILMAWIGVKASDQVVRETGLKDPGFIVVDEWVGLWIALWPLRWQVAQELPRLIGGQAWRMLPTLLVPFLLFRLFDIWKPWPIRQIQVLPDGQGIMADDVVAGLYALMLTQLLMPVLSRLMH